MGSKKVEEKLQTLIHAFYEQKEATVYKGYKQD